MLGFTGTTGQLTSDETKLAHIHVKVNGYIDKSYVDFVGQLVKKGQLSGGQRQLCDRGRTGNGGANESGNRGRARHAHPFRIEVIAYLKRGTPSSEVEPLLNKTRLLEGVEIVRYVSPYDAMTFMETKLGGQKNLLQSLLTPVFGS